MNLVRTLVFLSTACALVASAQAQLLTSLRLSKNQFVAGEPVIASVSITNHAGTELSFSAQGRVQWLDFIVKDHKGNPVSARNSPLFGRMNIGNGQTMSREVDLSQHFQLSEAGNYSVVAIVRVPNSTDGSSTNRVLFNLNSGRVVGAPIKVGVASRPGQTREFRLLNFSGNQKTQLYAQIVDGRSGQSLRTFLLGDSLMLRKPMTTIDGSQRMHVLFLATPTMWVHCVIDTDGKLVDRKIHRRATQGDPQFVSLQDGSVQVANSVPYDPQAVAAARAKIRKISERPAVTY